ncbi:STE3-domain-containing protein [Aulographum hederae CBS 113979]|uniref:STE3-domain-containing protein n=1 Tax=Aulographum hederae CBS 113979 TaxID=1176131 RepID=A0A6G1GRP9_9PEZI|nr:STE3-domain-containing protein [Aulographum hederae CBS 113979]
MYPAAIAVAVLAFISVALDLPPFLWHLRNRNVPACALIFWLVTVNFFKGLNATIWSNDDLESWSRGYGLCDLEIRFFVGKHFGIPAALVCCIRALAVVLDTKHTVVTTSKGARRKQYIAEIMFCFVMPILMNAVYYINQPERYYIFGITGCDWTIDQSWLAIVLIIVWPFIFCLIATYYSGLVLFRLYRYRRDFSRLLQHNSTTRSRFFRLFIFSLLIVLGFLPASIMAFIANVSEKHTAYSFDETHADFDQIVLVPSYGQVFWDKWVEIACGFLAFAFFGTGADALRMYSHWLGKTGIAKVLPTIEPRTRDQEQTSRIGSATWASLASVSGKAKNVFGRKDSHIGTELSSM